MIPQSKFIYIEKKNRIFFILMKLTLKVYQENITTNDLNI